MLARVIGGVIEPGARDTDRRGQFPRAAIDALGEAGILGCTVARSLGGGGLSLVDAASVVRRVAGACASTATVLQAHFTTVAVLNRHGPRRLRAEIASGSHVASCAVLEDTQRGNPLATSSRAYGSRTVAQLHGSKPWVPSAGEADSYLWSADATDGSGTSLWLVPATAPGLYVPDAQETMGLRGSGARTVTADPATVPADTLLGGPGEGDGIIRSVVLPWYCVLSAAVSLGIMDSAIAATASAVAASRTHRPDLLADLARIKLRADSVALMFSDTLHSGQEEATSVLALRAAAIQTAVQVTDLATKISQAASASAADTTSESAIDAARDAERRFRDARAAYAVPPTPDTVFEHVGAALVRGR